jgi:cyclophilin family peptidyl-prolyl cis-trans isomerase
MTIERLTSRIGPALRLSVFTHLIVLMSGLGVGNARAQAPAVTRDAILRAEDARGRGPEGIEPILAGLQDPSLRAISIRAIGRLERPELVRHLVPHFADAPRRAVVAEALAQSLRGLPAPAQRSPSELALLDSVSLLLRSRVARISGAATLRDIARSLGRLPFDQPRQAREVEAFLLGLFPSGGAGDSEVLEGIVHGLYSLARARRTLGDFTPPTIGLLRGAVAFRRTEGGGQAVRRAAWLALTASGGVDQSSIASAIASDPDAQVRRLAIAALPNVQDTAFRRTQLARVEHDRDAMVRLEWVRVYRLLVAATDCRPLLAAMSDSVAHVRLAAIDALGGACADREPVVAALRTTIDSGPAGATPGRPWHARAHALAALVRIDANATDLLRRDSRHPVWQVRMYVARGAAAVRDTAILSSLAFDEVGNVREVALQGLSTTIGHLADRVFVRALTSPDYHVVLTAARALKGAPVRDSVLPAVLDALGRISQEKRQTSRDPRLELLARVRELGDLQSAPRLQPLLADIDPAVATEAASVMSQLTGQRVQATPTPPSTSTDSLPSGAVLVRVTMSAASGGGTFDIALDANRAPFTVARVRDLILNRYYDGLTFHRVVPNFVLQGGSPGMNEYVGDGPFLRDELDLAHHDRYSLGISTRGRDTGDAQWFINLVDNYRLDHEYTVIGRIMSGFDVVDRILEGDAMESVRIVTAGRQPGPAGR